jgi:hypothetical protein
VRACGPWGHALLRQMGPMAARERRPAGRRFVGIDASSMQAPGATGPAHRLHIAMAWGAWPFLEGLVSPVPTGEPLKPCPCPPGALTVAARGEAQCHGRPAALPQGAALLVRLTPFRVVLGAAPGAPLALSAALQRQAMETLRPLAGPRPAAGGQEEGRGGGQA